MHKPKISSEATLTRPEPFHWWSNVTRAHMRIFLGAYLGWMFDGYETYTHVVVLPAALRTFLGTAHPHQTNVYFGWMIAVVLLGAGIGGMFGGALADYIGRKRVLLWSMVGYALLTGLTGLSVNVGMFAICRFLTGLALGAEWATGMTLVAESWPPEARSKACGILQSGIGVGSLLASGVWLSLLRWHPLGEDSWRLAFAVGAAPALLAILLRARVSESALWESAMKQKRWAITDDGKEAAQGRGERPSPFSSIVGSREMRRRLILTFLLSTSTSVGWWVGSALLPGFAEHLAIAQGAGIGWGAKIGLVFNLGGISAYLLSGFLIDAWGRRNFLLFTFTGALLSTTLTFLLTTNIRWLPYSAAVDGFFTLGCAYSWMATYLPQLFPVSVRATATSTVFNGARIVTAPFAIFAGLLIQRFGGVEHTAVSFSGIYILGLIIPWFLPSQSDQP